MDTRTGEVLSNTRLQEHLSAFSGRERQQEKKKFRRFTIGEDITIKGIRFQISAVTNQRVELQFKTDSS